jgi:hypothetical protein
MRLWNVLEEAKDIKNVQLFKMHLKLLCEITCVCAYDQYTWIQERLNNPIHDDDDDKAKFNF